eukprot:s3038_g12.t1
MNQRKKKEEAARKADLGGVEHPSSASQPEWPKKATPHPLGNKSCCSPLVSMPTCVPSLSCCLIARSLPLPPCCPAAVLVLLPDCSFAAPATLLPSLIRVAAFSASVALSDRFSSLGRSFLLP